MKVFVVRKKKEFYLESGDSRCSNIPIVSLRYFWAQEGVRDGKLSAILFINFALEICASCCYCMLTWLQMRDIYDQLKGHH